MPTMDPLGLVIVGIVIVVSLLGILIPVMPGLILETLAVGFWAFVEGTGLSWAIGVLAVGIAATGTVVKYLVPGRRLRESGIPRSTILLAGGLAIIGFFAVPVIGGPAGFVLGTYLAERQRLGDQDAWPSTKSSLRAVGLAVGIELVAGLLVAGLWAIGVVLTYVG